MLNKSWKRWVPIFSLTSHSFDLHWWLYRYHDEFNDSWVPLQISARLFSILVADQSMLHLSVPLKKNGPISVITSAPFATKCLLQQFHTQFASLGNPINVGCLYFMLWRPYLAVVIYCCRGYILLPWWCTVVSVVTEYVFCVNAVVFWWFLLISSSPILRRPLSLRVCFLHVLLLSRRPWLAMATGKYIMERTCSCLITPLCTGPVHQQSLYPSYWPYSSLAHGW